MATECLFRLTTIFKACATEFWFPGTFIKYLSQDYVITIIVIIIESLTFTYFLYTSLVNIDIFCQGVEVMEITSNIILYKIINNICVFSTVNSIYFLY